MTISRMQVDIRPSMEGDDAAILALLQASLGWVPDELFANFFDWKHRQSPFGASPAWVAVDGERIVGFRTFLRWEFDQDGQVRRAVRAVDTATHPDYQGKGIFSALTRAGLDAMHEDGVDYVFNTPNENSRPGYLKMGWQSVGRLPVAVRMRSPGSAPRVLRARVPADKWSIECHAGASATDVLRDEDSVAALLSRRSATLGIATRRTPQFLKWRYGFEPLRYRAVLAGQRVEDGMVIFRVRRRGQATEIVLCDVLLPAHDANAVTRLAKAALHESRADYALRIGGPLFQAGFVRLPQQGPILTWREVCNTQQPALDDWSLTMGDVELF
ncbi:MAG: GNAT family N-acetyltransferase [Acidimicrobiales bacterium]